MRQDQIPLTCLKALIKRGLRLDTDAVTRGDLALFQTDDMPKPHRRLVRNETGNYLAETMRSVCS